MSKERADQVFISIDKKLAYSSQVSRKAYMFRVHNRLRNENKKAYEPEIVAIGPYHHGKDNLQEMEKHKLRYLRQLLERRNESSVEKYVVSMTKFEQRARECYAEPIDLSTDEFVEMMLLDGCFIIELFRKFVLQGFEDPNDPIFRLRQIFNRVRHDLMLYENQLPLFILIHLLNMTKDPNPKDNIVDLALEFLGKIMPTPKKLKNISVDNVGHLLGLLHSSWCSSFHEVVSKTNDGKQEEWEFIKSTMELKEAGIKFKKFVERRPTLLEIKFENGVMEIPPLTIHDDTEYVFRNLIAYEQYNQQDYPLYVTDYAAFMDRLINSPKDAGKLRHYGIINNWLGDDEVISTMFNKLCNNVFLSSNFTYIQVFNNVNKHCNRRRNTWIATLKQKYFNNPWTIISFLAAVVLLLLTLTQTIFSVLSYITNK